MKKISKIFVYVCLISTIIIQLAFGFFVKNSKEFFWGYYNQQLNNYSSVFRKTIEMANDYTKIYEQSVADDLFYRLSALNQDLQDVPLYEIDSGVLDTLTQKYDLFGTAIFAKDDNGIFIHNSTVAEEIGNRTKDWGYWNTAFESLFNGESPSGQEGRAYDHYWIGPRSKSHYEPDYFRYAYYYNEQQDYLINAMIQDDNVYGDYIKNMLEEFFEHLYKEISYIEAISLIDLAAWEKAYYNNFKNPEAPAFLYGNFEKDILIQSRLTPDDLYAINVNKSFTFDDNGNDKTIFMVSPGDEEHRHLIAILINDEEATSFIRHGLSGLITLLVFTLAVLFVSIYYIVIRYKALLTFQIERNEEIERFTKNVAMLPEITYKCKLQNDELMLTYNYGKSMDEEQKITFESIYRPMKEIYSEDYVKEFATLIEPVFAGKSKRFEIVYNNDLYEHFASPIFDKDGGVLEIIGIANNITDRRLGEEQAKYFATHDFLTDLTNRRAFEAEVNEQISRTPDGLFAMLMIDLDGFKTVNDNYGHVVGDTILRQVANRISAAVMKEAPAAVVARIGGDEFSVFTSYDEIQDLVDIANGVIDSISEPFLAKNKPISVGASIGISLYDKEFSSFGQLLYCADMAMYHAKRSARGSHQFYSDDVMHSVKTK